jgi:hypothetical protein
MQSPNTRRCTSARLSHAVVARVRLLPCPPLLSRLPLQITGANYKLVVQHCDVAAREELKVIITAVAVLLGTPLHSDSDKMQQAPGAAQLATDITRATAIVLNVEKTVLPVWKNTADAYLELVTSADVTVASAMESSAGLPVKMPWLTTILEVSRSAVELEVA